MNFDLSREHLQLQEKAHQFAETYIRPVAAHYDRTDEFPWDVVGKAVADGIFGPPLYERHDHDESGLSLVIIGEELAWGCAGIALAILSSGLSLSALKAAGTPDQIARWGPRIFGTPEDPQVAAFAVTEPQAGSDVASIVTEARRDGDHWVLNGRKAMITNAGIADVHIVVASVDSSLSHQGQALFIVPGDTPGLEFGPRDRKLGIRASHTAGIILDDVRIPLDQVLGGVDKLDARLSSARRGEKSQRRSAVLQAIEISRTRVAAQAVGVAKATLEFSIEYAQNRKAFGRRLIDHQAIGAMLADMATEVEAARLLTYRAAWLAAQQQGFRRAEGSMAKNKAAEVAAMVTDKAVQICGGHGYLDELPVEKWFRDARIYSLFEGTSQIQHGVITKALDQGK